MTICNAFLTQALFLARQTAIRANIYVTRRFFTIKTGGNVLFFFPAMRTCRRLRYFLFTYGAIFLRFVQFYESNSREWYVFTT